MSIERYNKLIDCAIEIQQLRIELNKKLLEFSENITVSELKNRQFESEFAEKAMIIAKDNYDISESTHVKSTLKHKDVEIYLHQDIDELGPEAMKNILREIEPRTIMSM